MQVKLFRPVPKVDSTVLTFEKSGLIIIKAEKFVISETIIPKENL